MSKSPTNAGTNGDGVEFTTNDLWDVYSRAERMAEAEIMFGRDCARRGVYVRAWIALADAARTVYVLARDEDRKTGEPPIDKPPTFDCEGEYDE